MFLEVLVSVLERCQLYNEAGLRWLTRAHCVCLVPILYSVLGIFITQKSTKATNQCVFFFSPRDACLENPMDGGAW